MTCAMSISGPPVAGLSSEVMPKYFTPMPGKYRVVTRGRTGRCPNPAMMPQTAPGRGRAFPPDAHARAPGNCRPWRARTPSPPWPGCPTAWSRQAQAAATATKNKQHPRHREPADGRRVRVEHLVVDVVAERVGDGEQEPVGGGERGRETAGGDQARDHVRKARDLRRGEHDHVRIDDEVLQPHDAGMTGDRLAGGDDGVEAGGILAADLDQAELAPV